MVQKLKAWLLGVACPLTVSSTFAQTKIPASDPDIACGVNSKTYNPTFIPVYHTINCDMVERRSSEDAQGSLKAIAWDDRQSVWDGAQWYVQSNVQVFVEDENGNSITFDAAADFAAAPDIVIGDDMNNPGQDYIIGLIYNTGDQYMYHKFYDPSSTFMVVVDYWHITNVGTSSLAATLLNTEVLSTRATSAPHIDMWTDSTQLINGWLPALHQYAAVWTEQSTGGSQWDLIGYYDDIDYTQTNMTMPFLILDNLGVAQYGWNPDVSCRTEISNLNGTRELMDVVHTKTSLPWFPSMPPINATELRYTEWDIAGTTNPLSSAVLENTVYALGRIESMSQNNVDLTPNATQWQVCAIVDDKINFTAAGYLPKGYNRDAAGNFTTLQLHFPGDTMDHMCPAVSAGTGINSFDPFTSVLNIGNQYYMCGYYPVGDDPEFYYSRDVDAATSNLATLNYYQINQAPALNHSYSNKGLALSSSSNTGYNLLSAWSNGDDPSVIYYKESPNTTVQYRPAKASATQRIKQLTLSPNPASDKLTVNGIDQLGEYVILDMTGKLIQQGSSIANHLSVSSFIPGTYILEFRQGKAAYHFTFVKE